MITISPGHWAVGTGARDLIDEVTEARKVVKRVIEILRSSGITVNHVEDNTSKNQQQNLNYLVTQHNKTNRKLDVSVHFNSATRTDKGLGVEVLYYDQKELAAKVSKAISDVSGLINRGAKERKELAFLRNTNKPSILIEVCFVNSTVDVAIYKRDFEKICQAIAKCLAEYVGKSLNLHSKTSTAEEKKGEKIVLTDTARNEARELIRKACKQGVFNAQYHTEEKIKNYTDSELVSYAIVYLNRTAK
ncbi:N-acetylmuramoyl-L-alanine amidase [Ureibacillus sp. FSL K6-0165]|uniref:N-acetylmuramoyl-L-alanine amidase n=1 Tax=Ureibacillus sp. FSL K6-0165 TaxID=2954606 RepID=UPI0030F8E97C